MERNNVPGTAEGEAAGNERGHVGVSVCVVTATGALWLQAQFHDGGSPNSIKKPGPSRFFLFRNVVVFQSKTQFHPSAPFVCHQ